MINEKAVSYQTTNTYSTLNAFTSKTKNVWVVFHGIGYLSRYFLKYFRHLNKEENYFIAPQAPSKYYLNGKYEHVGASWATRENTETDVQNALTYLDEIYKEENLENAPNLILFGYSQGVSVVSRWVARRKIQCHTLIFHSGRIPSEITAEDLSFLKKTHIKFVYGNHDPFILPEYLITEKERLHQLFPENFEILIFEGGHEIDKELILTLSNTE